MESLAYSNFYSPRPQPVDPAVFFDLVKIRRLIDDATSLAVRAANGTTSSALNTSLSAANSIYNSSDAEVLGIGFQRGAANAKLSRERRHRMREHATQKLSTAYHLDEIATSVATMQAASALEDVAKHVLQRNELDPDAQYVHFFHEKIPSRSMAECTSLDPLNHVIHQRPTEAPPYRTRAVTRVFKEDFEGAARDCTDGLAVFRLYHPQHRTQQLDLVLARDADKMSRDSRTDPRLEEKDQPSSLEPQLLFHRGGAYLTLACGQIARALHGLPRDGSKHQDLATNASPDADHPPLSDPDRQANRDRAEARKLVRTYAKRALRDYISFLSHFDYTPGLSAEYTEAFLDKVSSVNNKSGHRSRSERLLDLESHSHTGLSEALVKYERKKQSNPSQSFPQIPKPTVHKLSALFASVPPSDLPPFPPTATSESEDLTSHPLFSLPDFSEAVTYHPLLTDVLHSLLLCHALIQTSTKEHLRHAHMVARVARVCDGYPILLAARSPSRADWIEVLRRSKNWLGLDTTWENLCAPAPLPGHTKPEAKNHKKTADEKRERIKNEAIRDALSDERVVDEITFRASVKARELRAAREEEEEQRKEYRRTSSNSSVDKTGRHQHQNEEAPNHPVQLQQKPKRWAQGDGKEYPITTEHAELIVRWVMEAPPASSADGTGRPKKKPGAKGRLRKMASTASSLSRGSHGESGGVDGLERSVDSLDLLD